MGIYIPLFVFAFKMPNVSSDILSGLLGWAAIKGGTGFCPAGKIARFKITIRYLLGWSSYKIIEIDIDFAVGAACNGAYGHISFAITVKIIKKQLLGRCFVRFKINISPCTDNRNNHQRYKKKKEKNRKMVNSLHNLNSRYHSDCLSSILKLLLCQFNENLVGTCFFFQAKPGTNGYFFRSNGFAI